MPQARSGGSSRSGSGGSASSSSGKRSTRSGGGSRSASTKSGSARSGGGSRATGSASSRAASGTSRARSTSSRSRSTSSRSSGAGRTRAARAPAGSPEARYEAAAQRLRKLNERIIEASREAGEATLASYEGALKAIATAIERGPGSSDIEWISNLATAQAKFLRDVTKSTTEAARKVLK